VAWDTATFPYLVAAEWDGGDPIIAVQTRDQRTVQLLQIDPADGACSVLHESRDEHWWEIVPGLPARLPDGRLVWTVDESDTRRLTIDGEPLTPEGLQVRSVADVGTDGVLFTASMEPTEVQLWLLAADGSLMRVSDGVGVHSGRVAGGTFVVASQVPDKPGVEVVLRRDGGVVGTIASYAERPVVTPAVRTLEAGERGLRTAVLLPQGHVPGSAKLPVLMAPYGGPGAQRVLATQDAYLSAQWLADQGFAVVVADGRGTPGRGPSWEREIAGDFATAPLQDQVDALHAAANRFGDLDLDRVGIMGWSFGGYLSALAVLRRPDVFHAAVAGAPVTDWTLYDTHYTERYLGVETQAESYRSSSLLDDAPKLERPLLIIHGLADDNVVAAHSLRLSSALLAAGKPHSVLPLSGVTHMTPQEEVAENLLLLQVDFLRRALTN
jgi:dipeptidyl-peptidase-4